MSKAAKSILREPLLHFLLLGAILFAAYEYLNPGSEPDQEAIVISEGQVEALATSFAKVWQRPPTDEELKGLVDQHIKEEIFSREAIKLGLDKDDVVIRRRLQQKMEFVTDDLLSAREPTDEDLQQYLTEHTDAFREEPRFTFSQVFLNPNKPEDQLMTEAQELLASLNGSEALDPAQAGDSTLLPQSMENAAQSRIEYTFGSAFSKDLNQLPIGQWSGPVSSGYGLHLVRLEGRTDGRLPDLAEVREAVRREWENDRRTRAGKQFYDRLLEQYQVSIDWPEGLQSAEEETRTAAN